MKPRELIQELLKEDIDADVFAKYTDENGNDIFFSLDGLALTCHSYKKSKGSCSFPTIILEDA